MRHYIKAAIAIILLPWSAEARPVSFPDGWMFMSMHDEMAYSNMLSYSPTARYAMGVRNDYMREDKDWIQTLTYDRLLKRWNAPDSQGNLFLQTGLGMAQGGDTVAPAGTLGMEADWETRRLYVSYENRLIYANNVEKNFAQKARFGVAPYEGGYDDIHTWLMVQVYHHPSERDNVVVTPFVRLFTQEVLGEAGVSNKGDVMFNVTLQF